MLTDLDTTTPNGEGVYSPAESTPIRLNIGGGSVDIPGFTLIDRRVGKEACPLDYPDNSVEEIYASHVLEHFGAAESVRVLREWFRVLKPGGRLRVAVPDLGYWCRKYVEGDGSAICIGYLYGGQTDENDYHKNGYDDLGLQHTLNQIGFVCCRKFRAEYQDCSALPVSLNMECNKPTSSIVNGRMTKRICAAMTVPRLGFTDQFCQLEAILRDSGITLDTSTGAYYNQGMEWAVENALKHDPEYVLAIDYDTLVDPEALGRLYLLADNYPEYDAFVPCQVRRGNEYCMFHIDKEREGWEKLAYHDVYPILSGHFGFTLLRAKAFAKCPKPWFQCQPNPNGTGWTDGKIDGDVGFWHKWRASGNTIALAPQIAIGHIETVVSWPGDDFRPIYQHIGDWRKDGKPKGVR